MFFYLIEGKLAYAWAELQEEMWLGNRRSTSPSDLKYTISRIAKQVKKVFYQI